MHTQRAPRAILIPQACRSPSKAPAPGRQVASRARAQTGEPWTPGKAHASRRRRTSATSSKLDVRGRLRCACNAASSAPPSEAATESPIPSRPPDARELFPTRVSVAPSGFRQWRRAPLQPRDRSLEVGPGLGINSQVFHGIRTNTTRNPNQKPGPTNCILNSPKSCFALGVLGSTCLVLVKEGLGAIPG